MNKYKVVDTDALIVEMTGMSISEIFKLDGEERFRDLESLVLRKITKMDNLIVALGGGALLREENRGLIGMEE